MAGFRLQSCAKILRARTLQSRCVEGGTGLTNSLGRVEPLKPSSTTSFHGAICRSFFLTTRGEENGKLSSQLTNVKSDLLGRMVGVGPGDGNSTEVKSFIYWPPAWFKALSGQRQLMEIEEVLSRVQTRKRKDLCAASSFVLRRRMVQNTSRRNNKNGDNKPSVLEAGVKYNVVKIDSEGRLQHLELRSSELGVHPRDVDLLSGSTFIPQRATIAVQRDKVLVRMENVRAIVYKDHVLLFDAHHPRVATEGVFVSPGRLKESSSPHRARDAFAESLAQQSKEISDDVSDPMPFHLRVMESLLEETSNCFHQKVDRLKLGVEKVLHELTKDVSMGGLQILLPLRRAVTEIEHDVRDAHQAIDQVLGSDETLQALCLVGDDGSRPSRLSSSGVEPNQHSKWEGGPQSSHNKEDRIHRLRQAAVDMLLTYQREVDDAGGVLEELRKGIEAAQEVWELGLDTTRNRIIRMDLYISILMCSITIAALPAAFFGMNLPSGFEVHSTLFYWVVGGATAGSVMMLGGLTVAIKVWPKIADKRRTQDLAGLLNLLRHLDSVDDIVEAVTREVNTKKVTRKQFEEILKSHHVAQFMRQKERDLIFSMIDTNRNEVIDAEDMRSAPKSSFSRNSRQT
ncbi:unnamed protein product [Calypogeia fissa]